MLDDRQGVAMPDTAPTLDRAGETRRVAAASAIGTTVEWYDFFIDAAAPLVRRFRAHDLRRVLTARPDHTSRWGSHPVMQRPRPARTLLPGSTVRHPICRP